MPALRRQSWRLRGLRAGLEGHGTARQEPTLTEIDGDAEQKEYARDDVPLVASVAPSVLAPGGLQGHGRQAALREALDGVLPQLEELRRPSVGLEPDEHEVGEVVERAALFVNGELRVHHEESLATRQEVSLGSQLAALEREHPDNSRGGPRGGPRPLPEPQTPL